MRRLRPQSFFRIALGHRLGEESFAPAYPDYVNVVTDNLVEGVTLDLFENDLKRGTGDELAPRGSAPPKFHAAYSSSALAVNCFAPFKRRPADLTLLGQSGFGPPRFEAQFDTGLGRFPPNLDVFMTSADGVLAIESKCTEYFTRKEAKFADAYDGVIPERLKGPWADLFHDLKRDGLQFSPLDAAQLTKHALGLARNFPEGNVTLLYLYWEPENAAEIGDCQSHRAALATFAGRLADARISFASMSYPALFESWRQSGADWVRDHAARLQERYLFALR